MAVTTSRKILVIDDEQPIVDLISDILSRIHCEPVSATKWVDAMEIIVRDQPDLIFLDLKMPTIDGASLLEFIRKQGLNVPVVVVSGYVTEESEEQLRKLGVSGIIRKPFQVKQITGTIEEILGPTETPADPAPAAPSVQPGADPPLQETPVTTDALYEAPLTKAPEPSASPSKPPEETSGDTPGIDSLYSLPKDAPPPSGSLRQKPPSTDEVLEALKNASGLPPAPSPVAQDAPAASEPPKAPPIMPILPTTPASAPAAPQPAQPAAEQESSERSFEEAVTARPSLLPTVDGPPPEEHRHHRRRSRGSRKSRRQNVMLMSVITIVCIIVAGFLAVMRHYASQVDLEQLKKNATRSAVDEAATKVLKEKLLEEIGK